MKPPAISKLSARARPWAAELTTNEVFWIEVIRLASHDTNPAPTLDRVQQLRRIFVDETDTLWHAPI